MSLYKEIVIKENIQEEKEELLFASRTINQIYKEWKKIGRRKNATNIVASSVNKISLIDPSCFDKLDKEIKLKAATIIMRCFNLPKWKPVESKRRIYIRLFPLVKKLQKVIPNTGTGGTLREIIQTRLSCAICYQSSSPEVFVAYEPNIPKNYLSFLFSDEMPKKVYRMIAFPFPEEFDELVNLLESNQKSANNKYFKNKR